MFILSDKDIDAITITQNTQRPNYNMLEFSYQFLNSVIVVQRNQRVSQSNPSVGASSAAPMNTNVGGY